MYEIIKQLSEDKGYVFEYGRRDFQNLYNEAGTSEQIYMFLDPVQIDPNYNEFNQLHSTTYSGSFMILKSSDLGDGYTERYLNDIKPIIDEQIEIVRQKLFTEEITINTFRSVEVINLLDYGFDGVVITYNLTSLR
jgi:hypothetical protein